MVVYVARLRLSFTKLVSKLIYLQVKIDHVRMNASLDSSSNSLSKLLEQILRLRSSDELSERTFL